MDERGIKPEVEFKITSVEEPWQGVLMVQVFHCILKEGKTTQKFLTFDIGDDGEITYNRDENGDDFLIILGLFENGIHSFKNHIKHCFETDTTSPIVLKTRKNALTLFETLL